MEQLSEQARGAGGGIYKLPGGKLYTLGTLARFLGWVKPSDGQATRGCREAFDAWHAPLRLVRMPQVRRTPARTMHRLRASARARRGG